MTQQRGVHLLQLHAEPTDLDLVVRPPHVDEIAVRASANVIACPVHACARLDGETVLTGWRHEIALSDTRPREHQLSHETFGDVHPSRRAIRAVTPGSGTPIGTLSDAERCDTNPARVRMLASVGP